MAPPEISGNFTEILLKTIYRTVVLSTHFFKMLAGKPLEEKKIKIKYFLLLLPMKEISGYLTRKLFKTIYRTVILSTHIFKILAGKSVEERIKKIKYFFMAPHERNFRKCY